MSTTLPRRSPARDRQCRPAFPIIGSVSCGTLRTKDLADSFIAVADEIIEWMTTEPGADAPARVAEIGRLQAELGDIERTIEADPDSEAATEALDALFDILDALAPEGFYFGANECDGADFGFWPTEEEEF